METSRPLNTIIIESGATKLCKDDEEIVAKLSIPCKHDCGFTAKANEMAAHWLVCCQRPTTCPCGGCPEVVPFIKLPSHVNRVQPANAIAARSGEALINCGSVPSLDSKTGSIVLFKMSGDSEDFVLVKTYYSKSIFASGRLVNVVFSQCLKVQSPPKS